MPEFELIPIYLVFIKSLKIEPLPATKEDATGNVLFVAPLPRLPAKKKITGRSAHQREMTSLC